MPRLSSSPWSRFRRKWSNCKECKLHEVRRKVVLTRGQLPCDVLFIGEAPGRGEDSLGIPFVGEAGKLHDGHVVEAGLECGFDPVYDHNERLIGVGSIRLAWTNLICCIPLVDDESGGKKKVSDPPDWAVGACNERLKAFILLTQPETIVLVGDSAAKHQPDIGPEYGWHKIVHPAAILRAEQVRKPVMIQRTVVTLRDVFAAFIPF